VRMVRFMIVSLVIGLARLATIAPAASGDSAPDKPESLQPGQQKRLDRMKSEGREASLTILPVRLAGKPWDRVSEVVGLLLEKQGLNHIEIGKTAFQPAAKADLHELAASLGKFVEEHPVTTEYVVYAEFNGDRTTGLNEIRAIVTDKSGAVVWTDRQSPKDKQREPMLLCVLLSERLGPQFNLNEETAKNAKAGKMAAIMDQRSGLPPESERAALPQRQKRMKEALGHSSLEIFPVRLGGAANAASATDLTRLINEAGLCKASPAKESVLLKASAADPNELKLLWTLAREFRDYLKKNPPDADYALYADYAFNPHQWEQGFVHFVVCDRKGEWIIVDMQNSHHPDYQDVKPTTREDCDKLLIKRLEGYLR
jgi:hypothetical protein